MAEELVELLGWQLKDAWVECKSDGPASRASRKRLVQKCLWSLCGIRDAEVLVQQQHKKHVVVLRENADAPPLVFGG
jgi:hypothetical protein